MREPRVKRTAAEFRSELCSQVELLMIAIEAFDAGRFVIHRQMANQLRLLLNAPPPTGKRGANSVPLLRQVGRMPQRFLSLSFAIDHAHLSLLHGPAPLDPKTPPPVCGLVNIAMAKEGAGYFAPLDDVPDNVRKWVPFHEWWTTPVLRDWRGRELSRMDLVLAIANTDGGAHVDESVPESYAAAKAGLSLGLKIVRGEGREEFLQDLPAHCMRQITHELMHTLRRYLSWSLGATQFHHPQVARASSVPLWKATKIGAHMALTGDVSIEMKEGGYCLVGAANGRRALQ